MKFSSCGGVLFIYLILNIVFYTTMFPAGCLFWQRFFFQFSVSWYEFHFPWSVNWRSWFLEQSCKLTVTSFEFFSNRDCYYSVVCAVWKVPNSSLHQWKDQEGINQVEPLSCAASCRRIAARYVLSSVPFYPTCAHITCHSAHCLPLSPAPRSAWVYACLACPRLETLGWS